MQWRITGPGLNLSGTVAAWRLLDLSRETQWFRSTLAAEWLRIADGLAREVGPERAAKWQQACDLRGVANSLQNNGANGGTFGSLSWRVELEPADDAEAA